MSLHKLAGFWGVGKSGSPVRGAIPTLMSWLCSAAQRLRAQTKWLVTTASRWGSIVIMSSPRRGQAGDDGKSTSTLLISRVQRFVQSRQAPFRAKRSAHYPASGYLEYLGLEAQRSVPFPAK